MPTITIINIKGGVGKTTTALTIGHGCALAGLKTLIIDLDPQGNCADGLGLGVKPQTPDLYNLLIDEYPLKDVAQQVRDKLFLIRSDRKTVMAKTILMSQDFREYRLSRMLEGHTYDVVLIDNAPSIDVGQTMALVASDYLVIPS